MLDHYDKNELLALIEGELTLAEAHALRAQLTADPPSRAMVERMIEDRLLLRGLDDPRLPDGLLLDLEPLLARPILVQPAPGEFRRVHRRRHAVWPRYAAAAVILLGLLAGIWAAVTGLQFMNPVQPNEVASADSSNPTADMSSEPGADLDTVAVSTPRDIIHHDLPANPPALAVESTERVVVAVAKKIVGEQPAAFALIISTDDRSTVEQRLAQALTTSKLKGALVRNFSFEEAVALQRAYMAASGPNNVRNQPLVASLDRDKIMKDSRMLTELAERARSAHRPQRNSAPPSSDSHLAGDRARDPSYEQQIQFSGFGATHTIAVPASELSHLLNQLGAIDGFITRLRMIREEAVPTGSSDLWLHDVAAVRSAIADYEQRPDDVMILVPIIVTNTD